MASPPLDDAHGENEFEILGVPVVFGGRFGTRNELTRALVAAQFDLVFGESFGNAREKLVGDFVVDEQRLDGVADAGTLAFGVDDDLFRHVEIGVAVDVHVADALVVFDDGDARFFRDGANQPFPAARDAEVDQVIELQQFVDGGAVSRRDDGDAVRRQTRDVHRVGNGEVAVDGFRTAAQDHGVACLETQAPASAVTFGRDS